MGSQENCIILMIMILSPICKARGSVETNKGDIPIQKEYFQLWKMQRASYMEYVYYAYVTTICFRKYVVTSHQQKEIHLIPLIPSYSLLIPLILGVRKK